MNQYTGQPEVLRAWAENIRLSSVRPEIWQFITYAFLHGNLMHIIGNMFFLYLFGNNVNDKLGNIGYLCFYLAGAVFSGVGHTLLNSEPVIGASGAVAAVTGAYLVLFPQTLVTVFWWLFIFVDTMEVPALYFIGFKLIFWDNILERRITSVAYDAHLAGYAFGILAVTVMLATRILSASQFDLWSMLKQWNRRRRYKEVFANGYDPFISNGGVKRVEAREVKKTRKQEEREEKAAELRGDIGRWIGQRNIAAAADVYLRLMQLDESEVIARQQLLDIANQLASENKHAEAAEAYEQFLANYGGYEYSEQVQLMLGLLYSRYLENPEMAKKHLEAACARLRDAGQIAMCKEELNKLEV